MPSLNEQEQEQCEGELTLEECYQALKSFPKNKSPGNDGITMEFHQKFWPVFGKLMVNALNEGYRKGELTPSQRQAVITLLDKNKDRTILKNWRPISLLNTDYKIATKALSNRLKQLLPKLINKDQVGYVQGRNILENIRTLQDVVTYTRERNMPGMLICIDFEKAFDSIEWDFLHAMLGKYNFGPSFKKWVTTIYKNISSCIINSGTTSQQFSLERGVRQGDPLSPYLFILVVELLSSKIKQNKDIRGININNEVIKLQQFADDTTCVLQDIESAKLFLSEVERFGSFSGLRLNKEKTEGLWLGSNSDNKTKPLSISWPGKPLRILGVYFSYDKTSCDKYNFEEKISKVRSVFNIWKSRNLTLLGKIQIVKTFIISQFLYTCSVITMPSKYFKEVNGLIYNFIWRGKRDKLKRSVMVSKFEKGGLKAPDLQLMIDAAKINWIKRYLFSEDHVWKTTMRSFFVQIGIDIDVLLQGNMSVRQLTKLNVPTFYKDLLCVWSKVGQTEPIGKETFLWYNQHVIINKKPLFYSEFYNIGIKYASDLYNDMGKLKPFLYWQNKGLRPSCFIKWAGLVSVVSNKLKQKIKTLQVTQKPVFNINGYPVINVKTKFVYEELVFLTFGKSVTVPKIINFMDNAEEPIEWESVYRRAHSVIDTATRVFQFKFLHDILVNNYWLCKWNITDNSLCDFCGELVEDLDHMYWNCVHVKRFWTDFKYHYSEKLKVTELDKDIVYLGTQDILVCTVLFAAKRYIYQSKFKGILPAFQGFLINMEFIKKLEFRIARNNNKIEYWFKKWEPLL